MADAAFGRIGGHDQERFEMHDRLFEAALGIARPWFVAGVRFDEASKVLTVGIDYAAGSGFALEGVAGEHPVHDSVTKSYRHLNFFQHECVLEVRTSRVKLPDGSVHLGKPPFAGCRASRCCSRRCADAGAADAVRGGGAHHGHLGVRVLAICRRAGARDGRVQRRQGAGHRRDLARPRS
jgi:hypothetical protein